jgi:pimeloyl-ACP methyl ester carboxylesterase
MPEVELSAGTIEYDDTGGKGPVLLFLHGLIMDGSLWRNVASELRAGHRCILPTLPLGGHRLPMREDADLSMRGVARLVGELLERLDLRDVTLVLNDWGGAQLLFAEGRVPRVSRLVLTSCEAFDNVPPGLPGRLAVLAARIPGGLTLAMQQLRLRFMRRSAVAWGLMSKRPVPHDVMDAWFRPVLSQRAVRRDLKKYLRGADQARRDLVAATEHLRAFDRPALVVWASEDRVMPPDHGRRLAKLLPNARLVEIEDSYTLIPEDQPAALASALLRFVRDTP